MTTETIAALNELLSAEETAPGVLTAEHRRAVDAIFEAAADEEALEELATCAAAALEQGETNLRALYARALSLELVGQTEESGRMFHRVARALAGQSDWAAAAELGLRALALRPDFRIARLVLEAASHLGEPTATESVARAEELCPESPDFVWRAAQRADAQGEHHEAEELAVEALGRYVAVKEADRAEEPLLRVLESRRPETIVRLVRIIPRMAQAGLRDLLDMTLDLGQDTIVGAGLQQELARTLEDILLHRKGFEHLRGAYVRALMGSLASAEGLQSFVSDCGLDDPQVPLEQALERFHEMFDLRPGAYVEHATLGVGQITLHDESGLTIDFADKPGHRMAHEIARRSLRPLPDTCLRVARYRDPEQIQREVESDPVSLLVRALADLGGQASARELRDCLTGSVVPEDQWSTWWKRAREAAQQDLRVDTSQAYRQVYRLAGIGGEDEVELPPLPRKSGAQSVVLLIERFLRQHPDLAERAAEAYSQELARRVLEGTPAQGVVAVPLLLRWLPDRADEWRRVAEAAFVKEPGVAAGLTADQQMELLELGLSGAHWQDAALTALASRFPPVRERALAALRDRCAPDLPALLRESLAHRTDRPATNLAIVRLSLAGALDPEGLSPWELLEGVVNTLAADPPPKLRETALEYLDPQEPLARQLRQAELTEEAAQVLRGAARELAASETGVQPLLLLLAEIGAQELVDDLRKQAEPEAPDPVALHFDPKVTLMTRSTYEQNLAKIRDLQHQLSNVFPREIAAARALGDLAENAEYHAARERQGIADATLRSLQSQMENARVIEDIPFPEGVVVVGTEVTVKDLDTGAEHVYWVLGQGDSVHGPGVINYQAPLGQSLVGKRVGDTVDAGSQGTPLRLEVLAIRKRLP